MYVIDSSLESPNVKYMTDRVRKSIELGIKMQNDIAELHNSMSRDREIARSNLFEQYGIENPNSPQQVLSYFDRKLTKQIFEAINKTGTKLDKSQVMPYVYTIFKAGIHEVTSAVVTELCGVSLDEASVECVNILVNNDIINSMYRNEKWTTNGAAMTDLALLGNQDAIDILTYRKAKKYAESVMSFIQEMRGDGCVHPLLSLGKTNRVNYSAPALMNIPKQLVWNMIAPRREGNLLISVDIKQQEPWIMINLLGITSLRQMLEEGGDLYKKVFNEIFDREPEPLERNELKVAWNAMTYGASIFGIKEICRHIDGEKLYKYFSAIPEFKKYKAKCTALAKKHVQTATTYFGTELYADELGSKLKRVLMDIPIQGTGADILALLVEHFDNEMEERELQDSMDIYYTRHDELILEIQQEFVMEVGKDKVFDIVGDIFEHRIDDWEPFKVEIKEVKKDLKALAGIENEED